MKILMGLDYYLPNYSGLTLYAAALAEGLAARGHQVSVLTHRHRPELPAESEENGVRILRAPVAARFGKALVSPSLLARALAEVPRSDVLHLHAPLVPAVPLASLASTARVPVVVTFHCDLQPPPSLGQSAVEVVARASQDFALDRASRIVTNTEDYARHTGPLSDRIEKVTWILPLVDAPSTPPSRPDDVRKRFRIGAGPVVFFLGRFAAEKGIPTLIEAFTAVRRRHPDATLVLGGTKDVAGETVLRDIEPVLADSSSGVVATGTVTPDARSDLFGIADVLALPSVNATESFGLVQVEGMLAGVPAVASDLPGVREPVRMTGMGEIARPGDAADLARKILAVLADPARYRRPGAEVRALFSREATLSAYEDVYRSAIHG
ncbi:MAG TPA: glycosyltransferase family 4 protein [Thermoanaerobaculia bacterium]|nr:glycosyltransferase family 4 protein [Thermoanaerobaculia bacterium]